MFVLWYLISNQLFISIQKENCSQSFKCICSHVSLMKINFKYEWYVWNCFNLLVLYLKVLCRYYFSSSWKIDFIVKSFKLFKQLSNIYYLMLNSLNSNTQILYRNVIQKMIYDFHFFIWKKPQMWLRLEWTNLLWKQF